MSRGKTAVILLSVLIIVSLALAGGVSYLLQGERKHAQELGDELEDVKAEKKTVEAELAKFKETAVDLDNKVRQANSSILNLNDSLERERNAKQLALYEIEQLSKDLEQQNSLREDLENKFSQVQSDTQKLQEQLKDLTDKKAELEDKLRGFEAKSQGVELGTIVVSGEARPFSDTAREQAGKASPAALEGKVLEVKALERKALEGKVLVINKDYSFAVINLGAKDGVKIGDTFGIYRSNKHIGDVKIERVHDSMSAAGFLTTGLKEKISEGDKAIQKIK